MPTEGGFSDLEHARGAPMDKLIAALDELPDGWQVEPNAVGNLRILDADGAYRGYIEFPGVDVTIFEEPAGEDGS